MENMHWIISKLTGGKNEKPRRGGLKWKTYIYSLFKVNHSMENKIIEYDIILLHKYKVEQTEVLSRLLFTFFLHKL